MNVPSSCSPIDYRGRFSRRFDSRKSCLSAPWLRESYEPRQTNEPLTNRLVPIRVRIVHNVRHEPSKWRTIVAQLDVAVWQFCFETVFDFYRNSLRTKASND